MVSDYIKIRRKEVRKRFLKSSVIGFGFLSGIWAGLGFDPGTIVWGWLHGILITADPMHAVWISYSFVFLPTILTAIAILLIYRRAGILGFIATLFAYVAGLLLDARTIPLLIAALIIGFFAAGKR